jgi:iron complex outermembrane receptor protein
MATRSFSGRLLASTVLGGAIASAMLLTAPASAQQAPKGAVGGPQVEELVVTGSLFRRAVDAETASPVTSLTAETLSKAGVTDVSQAVRSISADGSGSIASTRSSFSGGATAVSLRNVGANGTLVLIDGLRSVGFPMNDDGHISFVDLNSIPFSAVQEVQVLKDGASSLYGADAIGGVVNIIMKKKFNGYAGQIEAGEAQKGYGKNYRGNATVGFGDYSEKGWNFYVNGEYQRNDRVSNHDVGFPTNTTDLSSVGGLDNNRADDSLATATTDAKVRRIRQTDLNDPFNSTALTPPVPTGNYALLTSPANCANGTFAITTGTAQGVGCKHNITDEYSYILPKQTRYSLASHLLFRVNDNIEGHASLTLTRSVADYINTPVNANQVQPFGAPSTLSSNNIVLPVYICASGLNCATAADGRLNPNNPFAAAFAADPANGAAKLFYLFGDIPAGIHNANEVYRSNIGFEGSFGDGWNWKADFVGAKDDLTNTNRGTLDIAGLKQAINTGAYNFVNPSQNTDAVRNMIAPTYSAKQSTSMTSIDGSIAKAVMDLPGGPLQVAVGGQMRHEVQDSPGVNPNLTKFATTAGGHGKHTVSAGFFEVSAPVLQTLELTGSGRYDHYSEGFSAFSPKVGATFTPFRQLKLRGTWSKGFRAPSFSELDPTAGFSGGIPITLPQSWIDSHGGSAADYVVNSRSARGGFVGNANLKPEKSRSYTLGAVISPTRNIDLTVDYYNIRKKDVIVLAPFMGQAYIAYYSGQPLPTGYTLVSVADPDPNFPNAIPRATTISAPYANGASEVSTGFDFSATGRFNITDDIRLTSTANGTYVAKYNQTTTDGTFYNFVGTKGPSALSAAAGTPRWRANWQNSVTYKALTVSATTYFFAKMKNVAADAGSPTDLSCAKNLYGTGDLFCYIPKFIYTDVNVSYKLRDGIDVYANIGNITNAKAPLAPGSGNNFIGTWSLAGVIGRTFRVGAKFNF